MATPLTPVALESTFNDWRVRTNQIITKLESNVIVQSLNSVIQINGPTSNTTNAALGGDFRLNISSNALATTGGTMSGDLQVSANLVVTQNVSFSGGDLYIINLL